MKQSYRTVLKEASAEFIEKRSRFIASVKPVKSEEEALLFLDSLKKKYWDAKHNVYAYIIEDNWDSGYHQYDAVYFEFQEDEFIEIGREENVW